MTDSEAMQCALGYAWGYEDASGTGTYQPPNTTGAHAFALAFAKAWDEYNTAVRGTMVAVSRAYQAWNETKGETIFA
jgi:hypothetical protein